MTLANRVWPQLLIFDLLSVTATSLACTDPVLTEVFAVTATSAVRSDTQATLWPILEDFMVHVCCHYLLTYCCFITEFLTGLMNCHTCPWPCLIVWPCAR